jgi:hypothetical protein
MVNLAVSYLNMGDVGPAPEYLLTKVRSKLTASSRPFSLTLTLTPLFPSPPLLLPSPTNPSTLTLLTKALRVFEEDDRTATEETFEPFKEKRNAEPIAK